MLVINKIIIVGFVQCGKESAAYSGKDRNLQIFIFKIKSLVGFVLTVVCQHIQHWIRVNSALCTLIRSAGVELGISVGLINQVGRNYPRLLPYLYR